MDSRVVQHSWPGDFVSHKGGVSPNLQRTYQTGKDIVFLDLIFIFCILPIWVLWWTLETGIRYQNLNIPTAQPVSLNFASYWRTSLPRNLAYYSTPAVRPQPSIMICSTKRKVLDGLNKRYIYGRMVRVVPLNFAWPSSLPN